MKPASKLKRREAHIKSAFETPQLRNFSKCWIRRETQWNPRQTSDTRGSHEVRVWTPPLRKIL